jgi:predicted nucleic acid-binding protein
MSLTGLDTNVLSYALDPAFTEHQKASSIVRNISREFLIAINPTVIHETYHTLVYKQKWLREDATYRLGLLLRQKNLVFFNQTKSISRNAMYLANKYELGGRDSLILSNYLLNDVTEMFTHDHKLAKLGKVASKDKILQLSDPIG